MDNLRRELNDLKANLLYFQDLIDSHEVHVEKAAEKIAEAKAELQTILDRRDKAPSKIADIKRRIKHRKQILSKVTQKTDPRVQQMLKLKKKLQKLEEELGF